MSDLQGRIAKAVHDGVFPSYAEFASDIANVSAGTVRRLVNEGDANSKFEDHTLIAIGGAIDRLYAIGPRRGVAVSDFLELAISAVRKAEVHGIREVADTIEEIGELGSDGGDPVEDLALGDVEPVDGDGRASGRSNGA